MAKPLKVVLILFGALVGLFVLAAVAFAMFFDPNAFRGKISGEVKQSTGRELTIAGDIGITFFPWLGVKLSQVTLGNAPGFGPEPFAQIGEAKVSVRLMPLLHREIKASTVTLQGLQLNLAKNAQGKSNWEDLSGKDETTTKTPETNTASKPSTFEVAGIDIKDASLSYADAQAKKSYKVEHLDFKTGTLTPGKAVDFKAKLKLTSSDPAIIADVKADSTLDADTAAKHYLLKDLKVEVDAQGAGVPGGKQDVKLSGGVDLDQGKGTLKFSDGKLQLAGLTITTVIDGKDLNADHPTYSGPLTVAPFNPRSLLDAMQIKVQAADSNALKEASFNANLAATDKSASLTDVRIKLDQSNLTGRIDIRSFEESMIEFALKLDQIDADRYLAPKPPKSEAPAAPAAGQPNFNSTEIPIKTLDAYNAEGSLAIGSLKLDGLQLADANMKIALAKGKPKSDEISAKLYGGTLQSHTVLTPSDPPRVASKATVSNVQIGPLLKDMIGKEWLTGTGDLNFDISSSGRTVADVRHALAGELGFNLAHGTVRGVNIGAILRQAQALLRKEVPAAASRETQETDFAELKGHGRIVNGVLTTDTLSATNPAFRLSGEGSIDIGNEQLNYLLKPTIVENTEGAGGKSAEELRGITVPIRVTGTFQDPKYTPDLEEALKQQAAQRLNKEIGKQLEKHSDKIGGALGDILKRSLQKQTQQPAQAQPQQQQQQPPKNP